VIVANYSGGNIAVFGKIMMVALGNPNKWFSIMEKEVMLKDKRGTRSYGSFLQTESLCCRFRE
jgi:hypothetical protein